MKVKQKVDMDLIDSSFPSANLIMIFSLGGLGSGGSSPPPSSPGSKGFSGFSSGGSSGIGSPSHSGSTKFAEAPTKSTTVK